MLLTLAFLAGFLVPAVLHWLRLRRIQEGLRRFGARAEPSQFGRLFEGDAKLAHLWRQYRETLHLPHGAPPGDASVRATLPADTFLNPLSMVDGRLRTEFFKHLPGIFTGIGIIGTFAGLIEGLRRFQVSENAATVRASLEALMHAVGEAFLVSASAIALAMLVTFVEKLLLSSLYARSEDIAQAIDARFEGAAGEDYLSRLVAVSEGAAGREQALRQELVRELGAAWRESSSALGTRLEDALKAQGDRVADAVAAAVSRALEQGLREPLQQLAAGAAGAREGHAAADAALRETRAGFGDRLTAVLERQSSSASEAGRQGAREMQEAVQALQSLVNRTAEETRRAQIDASQQLGESLADMSRRAGEMLAALQAAQEQTLTRASARDADALTRTTEAVGHLTGQMGQAAQGAATQMEAAAAQMGRAAELIARSNSGALERLDAGARAMNEASSQLAGAATRAAEAMDGAHRAAQGFDEVGGVLSTGAGALKDTLEDYRQQREAVASLMAEFGQMLLQARQDVGMGGETLARIEAATRRLQEAQRECEQYLAGVSHVLGDAHQAFALNVRKTLELANTGFHDKLAASVGLLAATIGELESVLGQATPAGHASMPSAMPGPQA